MWRKSSRERHTDRDAERYGNGDRGLLRERKHTEFHFVGWQTFVAKRTQQVAVGYL
jgi:hypothetical protein